MRPFHALILGDFWWIVKVGTGGDWFCCVCVCLLCQSSCGVALCVLRLWCIWGRGVCVLVLVVLLSASRQCLALYTSLWSLGGVARAGAVGSTTCSRSSGCGRCRSGCHLRLVAGTRPWQDLGKTFIVWGQSRGAKNLLGEKAFIV